MDFPVRRIVTTLSRFLGKQAMDRMNRKIAGIGLLLAALTLSITAGCNLVATGMYVFTGNDTPAKFDKLAGKKVAIVCRPVTSLDFNNSGVATMLSQHIAAKLNENIKNITLVDHRKVSDWCDENTWEDYVDIGKALNADLVLGIDLEEFNLYQGQTLYQGRANLHFAVYDVTKGKIHIWEEYLPQVVYPPTGGVPASDRPEGEFRRKFVATLAERIAQHFYPHDSTASFASDSTVLY
jgi:hypothetical protein